jgi:hypothetical protein
MKHIEYDDSKNKQEVFHEGQKLTRPFGTCQAFFIHRLDRGNNNLRNLWIKLRDLGVPKPWRAGRGRAGNRYCVV